MALPSSPTWDIADFDATTIGSLLTLGPGDLTISPGVSPYFSYNADYTVLTATSSNGIEAYLDFLVGIPGQFTVEFVARFPKLPHSTGDVADHRAGLTLANDAGRGINIYFARTGVAVSRVDDYGSVSTLPDTTELTAYTSAVYKSIRVAVDGTLGRAYVYTGESETIGQEIQFIIPVEATPVSVNDRFRLWIRGSSTEPATMEIVGLRVATGLVIPDYPPVADPGPDRAAPVGSTVRFDGRASFDAEGADLSYSWVVIDVPYGSSYAADRSSGATVDDGDADGFTATLGFTAASLPAWVAAGDVLRIGGDIHVIDTVDNPGGSLTVTTETIVDSYIAEPFRIIRQSFLVDATTETPYGVPDVQGIYRVQLIVNDGLSDSEPAEVLANIVAARLPFGVEPDVSPIWQAIGDEWQLVTNREVFEEAWRGAAQILSGKLLELWQHHYNYSIRDAQRTFNRKWLAYRSLVAEPEPSTVEIEARYGAIQATHAFESSTPATAAQTLVFEYFDGVTPVSTTTATVTLGGGALGTLLTTINAALSGTGISAYGYAVMRDDPTYRYTAADGATVDDGDGDGLTTTFGFTAASLPAWVAAGDTLVVVTDTSRPESERYTIATVDNPGGTLTVTGEAIPDDLVTAPFRVYRRCRLGFKASKGFRLNASAGATTLGITTGAYNYLNGTNGARATDRSYFVGDGIDLSDSGVEQYDLLVMNNGQSLSIDRFLTDILDPLPNQRVLCFEDVPLDATATWDIPGVVRSAEVDFEYEGTYPGDLVKAEVYDSDTGDVTDATGVVVAQKAKQLAAKLDGLYGAFLDTTRYEIRFVGVKRRKAIPIPEGVLSIPRLQDSIPVAGNPTLWVENTDYVLDPFYRDLDGAPIPMLQFRDSVFIDSNTEPPDIFWAELTVFDNFENVEDLFGRLIGFMRDDASVFDDDFNYTAGVAGLLYSQQRGPSVHAIKVGANILLGQPFAEVAGVVESISNDYSPTTGRMLVRDADGNTPSRSEIVRTYYYRKDPLDTAVTSGLAENPDTEDPWAEGDSISQFAPIGAGVDILDLYNDPDWFIPFVRGGPLSEIEKFHYFLVQFNVDLVTLANLSLLYSFVHRVKPSYTYPLLLGLKHIQDDIDPDDDLGFGLTLHLQDAVGGQPQAFTYDDYRGDGTMWSEFDDGDTYFDGLVDCPEDHIYFVLELDWAGGDITYDSIFFLDTQVEDVDGVYAGPPGTMFTPTWDLALPAGTYRVTATIKGGGLVLP